MGLTDFLNEVGWDTAKFKMFLANLYSAILRFEVVEKLQDLGMVVFGNLAWVSPLLLKSPKSLSCFMVDKPIKTHEELVAVYQQSKISVNIVQLQSVRSLPYRFFDIMASDPFCYTLSS